MSNPAELLKEYEQWKGVAREAEAKIKELAPQILPLIPEDKEVEGDAGFFYIQKRPKWSYSEGVKTEEESLKKRKAQEEADGTAKVSYTPILYYKSKKDEDAN